MQTEPQAIYSKTLFILSYSVENETKWIERLEVPNSRPMSMNYEGDYT